MNSMGRFSEILEFSRNTKYPRLRIAMKNQDAFRARVADVSLEDICEKADIMYEGDSWAFILQLLEGLDVNNYDDLFKSVIGVAKKDKNVTSFSKDNSMDVMQYQIVFHVDFKDYDYMKILQFFNAVMTYREFEGVKIFNEGTQLVVHNMTINSIIRLSEIGLSGVDKFGIDWTSIITNDIYSIYLNFGIEAARFSIIEELKRLYLENGTRINYQHIALIADNMTYTGEVIPMNRYGIRKYETHVLSKASFEKTMEHFIEGGVFEETDVLDAVSSRISTGLVMKGGTGIMDVVMNVGAVAL
jgi:hypothetical protein